MVKNSFVVQWSDSNYNALSIDIPWLMSLLFFYVLHKVLLKNFARQKITNF